ncbi:hypothetical protein ABZ917_22365 [Nonomuraea wenchangensis]
MLSASRRQGYFGIHIEQGVPILDRDLNLLHDLISSALQSIVARYIGDGVSTGGAGFTIAALPPGQNDQDFLITSDGGRFPGTCLVNGIEISIWEDRRYRGQPGLPPLTTPAADRNDVVYLDVTVGEIDALTDRTLENEHDVAMETSTRLRTVWTVQVAEGADDPPAASGHARYRLARLERKAGKAAIEPSMIIDLRRKRLTMADIERRLSALESSLLPAFVAPEFTPRLGKATDRINLIGVNLDGPRLKVTFDELPPAAATHPATVVTSTASGITVEVPSGIAVPPGPGASTPVKITISHARGTVTSTGTFAVAL